MPSGTAVAEYEGVVLPVENAARSLNPLTEPASRKYEVGTQPAAGAVHVTETFEPVAVATRLEGAAGAPAHGAAPTETVISEDGPLAPAPLTDRTRT